MNRATRRYQLVLAAAALAPSAGAGTVSWNDTLAAGSWAVPGNWVGGVLPAAGDDVRLVAADATPRAVTFANPNPALAFASLLVESNGDADFTLAVAQDTLRVTNDLTLGLNATPVHVGRAVLNQSGTSAVHVGGHLALASHAGQRAEYTLSNSATLAVGGDLRVGDHGRGTFAQAGGTNVVTGTLHLAHPTSGGVGQYTLAGGDLQPGTVRVNAGGMFTMTGGRLGGVSPSPDDTRIVFNAGTFAYAGGQFDARLVNTGNGTLELNTARFEARRGLVHESNVPINVAADRRLEAFSLGLRVMGVMNSTGTVVASSITIGNFIGAPGTFTQSGGTVAGSGNASGFSVGKGSYALDAGRFAFPVVHVAGAFNQAGGTAVTEVLLVNQTAARFVQTAGVLDVKPTGVNGFDSQLSSGELSLAGAVNWGAGARLTVSGGTATLGGLQSWHPTASLRVTGGTATLATDAAGTGAASLDLTLTGGTLRFAASQHLAAFSATNAGTATLQPSAAPGQKVLVTRGLALGGTAKLDLTNNALVLDHAPGAPSDALPAVRTAIVSAMANGWTGPGLTSSTAAANSAAALGYARASDVLTFVAGGAATFLGETVDDTSILVHYTLAGDATLDGVVDFNDLVRLAQNYNTTVSATTQSWWFNGDFTYDGLVDFNDLVKLAQNYNSALPGGAVHGAPAGFGAELARAFVSVPEPSVAWAVAAVSGCGFLRRRRRGR